MSTTLTPGNGYAGSGGFHETRTTALLDAPLRVEQTCRGAQRRVLPETRIAS